MVPVCSPMNCSRPCDKHARTRAPDFGNFTCGSSAGEKNAKSIPKLEMPELLHLLHWGYIGIMEKKAETTIIYWWYTSNVDNNTACT